MRGLKLFTFVMISMMLSACSLFLVEDTEDKVCIPKSRLSELNLTMDDLLGDSATATIVLEPEADDTMSESSEPLASSESEETEETAEQTGPADAEESAGSEETEETGQAGSEETEPAEVQEPDDGIPVRRYKAGDLVEIAPTNAAPDIVFTYSAPLDADGRWQTTEDDVGEYIVEVTGTNAGGSLTKKVRIVIESDNNPPTIDDLADIVVDAGDEVVIFPVVADIDGDDLVISYSGWMDDASMITDVEDVGEHVVTVSVTDGKATVSTDVNIVVIKPNTPPVIADLDPITVIEGELVEVVPVVTDADGNDVTVTFSAPLGDDGKWQTEPGDAGAYSVKVVADDGKAKTEKRFSITVLSANHAPEIEQDSLVEVTVVEGETKQLTLAPVVTDADGDDVTVSYSGFMTTDTKEISAADEGEHIVTITASDGKAQTSMDVIIVVTVHVPPSFEI